MKNILLMASGGGSNVKAILQYFKNSDKVHFPLIITNKKDAGVIDIAKENMINILIVNKEIFEEESFIDTLDFYKIDLIVLAGFLWKIPNYMIANYHDRIVNIHPALLPKYGGKGMYGHFVHEAVKANNESESGITIHLVNQNYDEGRILLQKKILIHKEDDAETIAKNVLALEHTWYAKVIESLISIL